MRRKLNYELWNKEVPFRWVPNHRHIREAKDRQDKIDIQKNDEVDRLAKKACHLPLPETDPVFLDDIYVASGPTPRPAKKWTVKQRLLPEFEGAHWVFWLPMKGIRRMVWITRLWGNARWEGCGPPWAKQQAPCPICGDTHQTSVHRRLIQCSTWSPDFRELWASS